jgi:hypothetical protein
MKDPQPIEIEQSEVEQLIGKAKQGTLDAGDQKRLVPLLKTLLWLEHTLLESRISLSKLKRILFGKKTEKPARKPQDPDSGEEGGGQGSDEGSGSNAPPGDSPKPSGERPQSGTPNAENARGHGRRAAADYPGAETIICTHGAYQRGDRCPLCERGRLYSLDPLVRLRFTGQPLALVRRFELERLRCGTCGALWVASMPPRALGRPMM